MMRLSANILFLLYSSLLCPLIAVSQDHPIDSMEKDLQHPADDTVRIKLLYNLGMEYYGYDTVKGMEYLEKGHALAEKMNYLYQIANYYETKAKVYLAASKDDVMGWLDTAILYYKKDIARKPPLHYLQQAQLSVATCQGQKGTIMSSEGHFKEAIALFLDALTAWKASDEPNKNEAISIYYSNISSIYYELNQIDKALEYDKAALPYRMLAGKDDLLAYAYIYIGDDYSSLEQYDSVLVYLERARPIVEKLAKPGLTYSYLTGLARVYRRKKDYARSIKYYKLALPEAFREGNPFKESYGNRYIAETYIMTGNYDSARIHLLAALPIAEQNHYNKERLDVLKDLVSVEDKSHHLPQAYDYLQQLDRAKDSVKTEESKSAVAEIENKYQSSEKGKEILKLQKDKEIQSLSLRQKSTLNYILFGSLGIILILGLLLYRNYRQKQQIQQQQISELEKDRQLMAVSAMLKGQEEERSRLAKDLHDGLGGMLSGVKFSLGNIKGNLIVTPDNIAIYERSLDMIDSSIKELRRVAHNMMPEMLVKFGLDEALKEYCNSITATRLLDIRYQSFGMKERLDGSVEIIIYRIVQELLNNTLKHASASEVLVQLIREDGRLSVLVEDNGRGFDVAILDDNKGAGWVNIRSRVDYLKGNLDINTEAGKGSTVTVEINV